MTTQFTPAAQANIEETGINPAGDVDAVRAGMTAEALLSKCLDGADQDRAQGWREYVDAIVAAAETIECECGEWMGEKCEWSGPISETVLVEYMPEHLRATHEAAGGHGIYPHNGAVRVRVERSCATCLLDEPSEEGWAAIVG